MVDDEMLYYTLLSSMEHIASRYHGNFHDATLRHP